MMRFMLLVMLMWSLVIGWGIHIASEHFAATRSMVAEVLYLRQQQAANQRDINQLNDWYFEMREKMRSVEKR